MAEATVCVNEETRITLCSIRATKGNPPFSCSVAERKIMNHFVVKSLSLLVAASPRYVYFSLLCSRSALRIFSGVIGKVFILTPTASKIALLITAAVGSMFNSPRPLAPNGPVGS